MISHQASGLGIVTLSGILTASFPFPLKFARKWYWENTWLVYSTLALVIIPISLAAWTVPHLSRFYASIPPEDFILPLVFGFGWGIAQVTFGLSIARVGMAMAFAIVIGLSSLLGSMVPLALFHPAAFTGRLEAILIVSAMLLVMGIILYAWAGHDRDRIDATNSPTSRRFLDGILLCVFTGCFGSMINLGFVFGGKIADQAQSRGISSMTATLCVWAIVLAAGYLPNAFYTLYLLRRNNSTKSFKDRFLPEALLGTAAAFLWFFGMFGYGIGASVMGIYGNSIGFAVCMTVLLLWASALGIFSGEWRAASSQARLRMYCSVGLIAASMLTLGFGSLHYGH